MNRDNGIKKPSITHHHPLASFIPLGSITTVSHDFNFKNTKTNDLIILGFFD